MVVPAYVPGQRESSDCPWNVGSTGVGAEGLEELCRARHCGNHTVQMSCPKACQLWCVCGCKSLPDSCSNSSLLSLGQEGALAAGPSSPSQREGTKGTFSVKFPLPPLHGTWPGARYWPVPTEPLHWDQKETAIGWVRFMKADICLPSRPRKSARHKRL